MINLDIGGIRSGLEPLSKAHHIQIKSGHAAVLVPLVQQTAGLSLLLTRRSQNLSHHGGEVAFPGGMWEPGDPDPTATALREAEEEVALNPELVTLLGLLPPLNTRQGTRVTPVVGMIPTDLSLIANPDEIDSIFKVPITALDADQRIRTDIFGRNNAWAPAYQYEGYEIWGFTAVVIKLLLERCFQFRFERQHHAPEKTW